MDAATILDSLNVYVYSKDRDGKYTYANRAVCELFGSPLSDVLGKDDSQFFDLEESNELRSNDQEVMASGAVVEAEEHDVVKETGEDRYYWTIKAPLRGDSGAVVGICGISLDITGSKA